MLLNDTSKYQLLREDKTFDFNENINRHYF